MENLKEINLTNYLRGMPLKFSIIDESKIEIVDFGFSSAIVLPYRLVGNKILIRPRGYKDTTDIILRREELKPITEYTTSP
ncbi:hypothetical protein D6810_01040 [Candidatus Dojkabacteria bacterium]|uniref:Uncharacterized protein n=1 Tax=Candidatus Dojkabacteria bacterium TaxID=2099670 RepID=A0A3M0Z069_9BACT|nr:MAG: hypothetical protein D6810_01040 [Candidatus Dojkabacteria bacterium]